MLLKYSCDGFLIWTGLVEAGMLVVGCARRVENIEKLASQLTQHTGKVKFVFSFYSRIMLTFSFYSLKTNLAKPLPNFAT